MIVASIVLVILALMGVPLFIVISASAILGFISAEIDLIVVAIEFYRIVEPMRESEIWGKDSNGDWHVKDAIWKHDEENDEEVLKASQILVDEENRTFSEENRHLYYNPERKPIKREEKALDEFPLQFEWV